jgi:hypothetical protein
MVRVMLNGKYHIDHLQNDSGAFAEAGVPIISGMLGSACLLLPSSKITIYNYIFCAIANAIKKPREADLREAFCL